MTKESGEQFPPRPAWKKVLFLIIGIFGFLLLISGITLFFIDAPLRGYIESQLNRSLTGYSVELEGVDFHPLNFSIDFQNLILRQETYPDPPLLKIPSWTASLQWKELLKMEIVSDHEIVGPELILDFIQAKKEVEDATPIEDRGWQQALFALYPVTINSLHLKDGFLSYSDRTGGSPMEVNNIQLSAENIQNIHSPDGEYPSNIELEGTVHGTGRLHLAGKANFLAEPFPGVSVDFVLKHVQLEPFVPVASLVNVRIHSGNINGEGHFEYSPWRKEAKVTKLEAENPSLDYWENGKSVSLQQIKPQDSKKEAHDAVSVKEKPFRIVIEQAEVKNGEFSYVNQSTQPPYKIFVNHVDLHIGALGRSITDKMSEFSFSGKFMGSGNTTIQGDFRPEIQKPDFAIKLQIEKTEMKTLNKVFKAYGGFDVVKGKFSIFSELSVHEGQVKGYIKPFFENPEIYDFEQDKTDNLFIQMYEGFIGIFASILEEDTQDQVATKTDVSGNIKNMNVDSWELLGNLIRNAFIDALKPALENIKIHASKK